MIGMFWSRLRYTDPGFAFRALGLEIMGKVHVLWSKLRNFGPDIMNKVAPPVFHDDGAYDIETVGPPVAPPDHTMWIILYRGELSQEAQDEVAGVLAELRAGGINRFQANAELYEIAVELKQPILFWATTYERYSGAVLEWND